MKYIFLIGISFFLIQYSFAQQKQNYVDSIESTVIDMKEELKKIKNNYYS